MPGSYVFRLLEDNVGDGNTTIPELASPNDARVLRDTFMVYGTLLLSFFIIFCFVRREFPRPYTLRQWVEGIKTPLAGDQFGFVSWIWNLYFLSEDQIMCECGMDALCLLRILSMGFKIAQVGMMNAFWLFGVYWSAPPSGETDHIKDGIIKMTIANVPSGSFRFIATAVAAYIQFAYTMFTIFKEFDWFIVMRHKFLTRPLPRNYTVFCRNIPSDYHADENLANFFKESSSERAMVHASVCVYTKNLSKLIDRREAVVTKLEKAVYIMQTTGKTPTHKASVVGMIGGKVESIPAYVDELKALNDEIKRRIEEIESKRKGGNMKEGQLAPESCTEDNTSRGEVCVTYNDHNKSDECVADDDHTKRKKIPSLTLGEFTSKAAAGTKDLASAATEGIKMIALAATDGAGKAASTARSLFIGDDGDPMSSGFITFSELHVVSKTLQMTQCDQPFAMEAIEAPDPSEVLWSNVGRSSRDIQVGMLVSNLTTAALCLLWTIPIAFLASLSSVAGLQKSVPFIDDLIKAAPFLEPLFQLIAPLMLVAVNGALPDILVMLSSFEGHISSAVVEASAFGKLATFMIIQTFFVSAISGSVIDELSNIISRPTEIVDLLANSLPGQSTYFIQIIFIGVVIPVGLEMLRMAPLCMALVRRFVGPRLREKDRTQKFLFIRPLADPDDFQHADVLSQIVLYFMVMLVYAVISPVTCFVIAFCFLYMGAIYRHQFVYIYPARVDSGGKLWTTFIKILLICMIIAEVTIMGFFALKKAATAVSLMIPLLALTALFNLYIRQKHFRVAEFLPANVSAAADRKNGNDFNVEFGKNAFIQPELQAKELFPDIEDEIKNKLFCSSVKESKGRENEVDEDSFFDATESFYDVQYGESPKALMRQPSRRNVVSMFSL